MTQPPHHMPRMSATGIAHLIRFEGHESRVYKDVAGLDTIGVGHLLTPSERSSGKIYIDSAPVIYRDGLSDIQIARLLAQDLLSREATVWQLVRVPLVQKRFDVLVSFVFNVGQEAFARSTLLKRLNAGEAQAVPDELLRWVFSAGKRWKGLERRREAEARMWKDPAGASVDPAHIEKANTVLLLARAPVRPPDPLPVTLPPQKPREVR